MPTSSRKDDAVKGVAVWHWLQTRLRDREDSEHEQILIRVGFAALILTYLLTLVDGQTAPSIWHVCLVIGSVYAIGSLLLLGHVLFRPNVSVTRRLAGMLLDLTCLPVGMIVGEAWVAPLYPMYLWISLGMGFRYGRDYLFAAAGLSLIGFGAVIALTDFWRSQPAFAATLWFALLVLPAYTSTLLAKLTHALNRTEQASQAKSRFVASVSHELRTPLNAIIGMSDLLNIERLSPQQRDMARTISNAGQTLLDMVDDVLSIAQIESGKLRPNDADFDLHAMLASVRYLHHQAALEKGLDLRFQIEPDVPFQLHGDDRSLRQILINLVTNAIKFTSEGHVAVKVSSEPADDGRIWLCMVVEDTGCGIALKDQERIFERFSQAEGTAERETGGTGLGLAIARQLTEMMGGRLTVESRIDQGARFSLILPFEGLPAEEPELRGHIVLIGDETATAPLCRKLREWGGDVACVEAPSDIPLASDLKLHGQQAVIFVEPSGSESGRRYSLRAFERMVSVGCNAVLVGKPAKDDQMTYLSILPERPTADALFHAVHAALALPVEPGGDKPRSSQQPVQGQISARILVADDNAINRKVIAKMLSHGGHETTIVDDGEAMLDALEHDRFDLVLFDLDMPGLDGLKAFQIYRFGTCDDATAFVTLTADATEESRRRCLEAGIDDYLTKPIRLEELLDLVDRYCAPEPLTVRADEIGTVVRDPRFENQLPVVDQGSLDRLRGLSQGDDFLSEVLTEFIDDTEDLVDQFEAAVQAEDAKALRDTAHALRSSAAYIGARRLVELCLGWRGVTPDEVQRDGDAKLQQLRTEVGHLKASLLDVIASETKTADVSQMSQALPPPQS